MQYWQKMRIDGLFHIFALITQDRLPIFFCRAYSAVGSAHVDGPPLSLFPGEAITLKCTHVYLHMYIYICVYGYVALLTEI